MTALFITVLKMSVSAGILICVVLLLRLLLKKAPKDFTVILWGLVALRLMLPVFPSASFSLLPETDSLIDTAAARTRVAAVETLSAAPADSESPPEQTEYAPSDSMPNLFPVGAWIWGLGTAAMAAYWLISSLLVRKRVSSAVCLRENVYLCGGIPTPFVLGVLKPRIYLPEGLDFASAEGILRHETMHIRRLDPLWKLLAFVLLSVHWFNPLCYVAFVLFSRDLESACDERTVRTMTSEERADYSESLLLCSVGKIPRRIPGFPVAFGETAVKERVKNVLNYRKPSFWAILIALILCILVMVFFLTNPGKNGDPASESSEPEVTDSESGEEENPEESETTAASRSENIPVEIVFEDCTVTAVLPENCTIVPRESFSGTDNRFLGNGLLSVLEILDADGQCVGIIGCSPYTEYEGAEDVPAAIFSEIANGNDYQFNVRDRYDIVAEDENGATALTDVTYSFDGSEETPNLGIVSYRKDLRRILAVELDSSVFDEAQATALAESLEWQLS